MKRFMLIFIALLFIGSAGVFAADVTATLPSVYYLGTPVDISAFQGTLDGLASSAAADLAKFDNMDKAAEAFGNAASYAADGANQRGLMGYKFLTIAVGTMVGFQAPGSSLDNIGDYVSQIEDDGDAYFGAGLQALTLSVGLNSSFLLDGLFLSAKVGKFSLETDDVDYDSFNFGILANYQLVDPFSIGVIKWRGIQVGSGFIYYNSTSNMIVDVPEQTTTIALPAPISANADLVLDPTLNAEITSSGLKMPIDILSGIRLLWIANLNFGIGADLNLASSSEVALSADGETYFENAPAGVTSSSGTVKVSVDEGSGSVDFIKLRAMFGLGFALGPVKLDIPFTYYFDGTGFANNIGITGAVTF